MYKKDKNRLQSLPLTSLVSLGHDKTRDRKKFIALHPTDFFRARCSAASAAWGATSRWRLPSGTTPRSPPSWSPSASPICSADSSAKGRSNRHLSPTSKGSASKTTESHVIFQAAHQPHQPAPHRPHPPRRGRDLCGAFRRESLGGNAEIVSLTGWLLPGILFICLYGLNISLLNCYDTFFIPSFAPFVCNAIWIGAAFSLRNQSPARRCRPLLNGWRSGSSDNGSSPFPIR